MMKNLVLINNNLIEVNGRNSKNRLKASLLGTVLSNMAYYGYVPNVDALDRIAHLTETSLKSWWSDLEPVLKEVSGDNKKMDKFVVYKNFPQETLDMTQGEYWIKQIFMYFGCPNEWFAEDEMPRESMLEDRTLKVLHLANKNSLSKILGELLKTPARWIKEQKTYVNFLVFDEGIDVDVSIIAFKENLVSLVADMIKSGNTKVSLRSATDVLRLAVGLSDGDVSLREKSKFKNFSRPERRFLLGLLENTSSLEEDMARRKSVWKKLMRALHPNDYRSAYPRTCEAYNKLYNDDVKTFNSKVEQLYADCDPKVLDLLAKRPGDFVRRLHCMVWVFGDDAVKKFTSDEVLSKLTVSQLLKVSKFVENVGNHCYRMFPPKGNWAKVKIEQNKTGISEKDQKVLVKKIDAEIAKRVRKVYPSVNLSSSAKMVRLQTSDSELTSYGRGTEFPIPKNVKFIRTASYWESGGGHWGCIWYDNGWNFFDENWNSVGTCCWNTNRIGSGKSTAAIFSGDPTNSKEMKGRACQMIDLYIDELEAMGIRYGVWNILCYNKIPFSKANEVYAALQWGEEPQKGKLFEPSRCQLSFPLEGDNLTKYIAYIDVVERKVVYLDANFRGNVRSAALNAPVLQEIMPAFVEYLENIPSVHDLFKGVRKSKTGLPVAYDDSQLNITDGEAYVFKPVNEENSFDQVDITKLLV